MGAKRRNFQEKKNGHIQRIYILAWYGMYDVNPFSTSPHKISKHLFLATACAGKVNLGETGPVIPWEGAIFQDNLLL